MQYINFDNWKRKNHYNFFQKVDNPQFNICSNIDVTNLKEFVRKNKISFYYSMIYASTYVMNEIEDFRYKIRNGQIILHDKLQPSFTDMSPDEDLFKIITLNLGDSIVEFSNNSKEISVNQIEYFPETDSIPRISFGKYFEDNGKIYYHFLYK